MSSALTPRRFSSILPLLGLFACKDSDITVQTFNTDPSATIQEPSTGLVAAQGDLVNFRGLVQDAEDDPQDLSVVWTSDVDGVLSEGAGDADGLSAVASASLTPGSHAITLEVVDSGALSARDTISITIEAVADAPTIQIRSPNVTDTGMEGEDFSFEALVQDEQDAPLDLKLAFESDMDGLFCEPLAAELSEHAGLAECEETLSPGAHLLTFRVTDTDGNEASAQIAFNVISFLDIDDDGDGFTENQGDCDDDSDKISPTSPEKCNGEDEDCDGAADNGLIQTWYADADFDTYGNPGTGIDSCNPAAGWVNQGGDCDDTNKLINPIASEGPGDSIDQNCDGTELCYVDGDTDSFRSSTNTSSSADTDCSDAGEFANTVAADCNDADANVKPGALDNPDDAFLDANCDGIDGDRARAVFVAPSPVGNDANSGLTSSDPVASLARATTIGSGIAGRDQILLQSGSYTQSASVALTSGDSWYGGYGTSFGVRTDSRASITTTSSTVVTADSLTAATVIDRVDLIAANAAGASAHTLTVRVSNTSGTLTIRRSDVTAGDGAAGSSGGTGSNATSTGANGGGGSGSNGGGGGGPGGGNGASGVNRGAGPAGGGGAANGSPGGGSGGAGSGSGGLGCNDGDPRDGGPGGNGQTGFAGSNGGGGNATGTFNGSWTPSNGGAGGASGIGGGGGGGGAGGGENCTAPIVGCIYCDTGRGGGGGGGGGGGAGGGGAGTGGGASIAIGLLNSRITLEDVNVRTGSGGAGGLGGAGGTGGFRGTGGAGQTRSNNSQGNGGRGGDGGNGGGGGCGGGGGGGPTVPLWGSGSVTVTRVGTVALARGSGGAGGTSCQNNGAAGTSADTIGVTLQ